MMEVVVEIDETLMECEERVLVIADMEAGSGVGYLTVRKIDDRNLKRRMPSCENIVVRERKEKRLECAHCDYVSRAQYITARHVARIHQNNIKPMQCDMCEFKTIYKSNLKRHHNRVHKCKSESSELESKIKLELKSEFKSEVKVKSESDSSIIPLN